MHHSAIYDPRAVATPSERLFAAQRRLRQQRIERAAKLFTPKPVQAEKTPEAPPESPKEWLMRQIAIAMPPVNPEKIAEVKAAFSPDLSTAPRPRVTDVMIVVAEHFGIEMNDLVQRTRMKHIAWPRHYALYLSYQLCGRSMPDLGRRFGNRDHTSVLSSVHKIRDLLCNHEVGNTVDALTVKIRARAA